MFIRIKHKKIERYFHGGREERKKTSDGSEQKWKRRRKESLHIIERERESMCIKRGSKQGVKMRSFFGINIFVKCCKTKW